jgi:hypothetical protein
MPNMQLNATGSFPDRIATFSPGLTPTAAGAQVFGGLLPDVVEDVADHHRGTGSGQGLRHACAEALGPSGDERLAPGQVEHSHANSSQSSNRLGATPIRVLSPRTGVVPPPSTCIGQSSRKSWTTVKARSGALQCGKWEVTLDPDRRDPGWREPGG